MLREQLIAINDIVAELLEHLEGPLRDLASEASSRLVRLLEYLPELEIRVKERVESEEGVVEEVCQLGTETVEGWQVLATFRYYPKEERLVWS